jgi:LL-diaminopimelate aminotransferase
LPLIGTKEGIANISFTYVDPGDLNLVPDPGYPVYSIGTRFAGGETYKMPLNKENSYLPDLEAIPSEVAGRAKLLFINYPNNPTGAVASLDYFRLVAQFARRHGILVCHDAAYSELVYDGKRPLSFLEAEGAKEVGIEFNSLSKTFNMTGWRIGFAVGNPQAIEVLGRFKTNIDSGLFGAIQYTGVEALTNPGRDNFIASLRARYQERRDIVTGSLERLGWPPISSPGAFYVWAPVPGGFTSQQFVTMLLEETGVVVTPGSGFGEYGEGYFRIALTVESDRLREAMERIGRVIKFS